MSRLAAFAVAALLATSSGCILLPAGDLGEAARAPAPAPIPSSAAPARARAARPAVHIRVDRSNLNDRDLRRAWREAAERSGFFSEVSVQAGSVAYAPPTDLTIDVRLSIETEKRWTTWIGVLTLTALPLAYDERRTLDCIVRGPDREEVGRVRTTDRLHTVIWLPLLPVNVLATIIPSGGLAHSAGLDAAYWDDDRTAIARDLLRAALAEARGKGHL